MAKKKVTTEQAKKAGKVIATYAMQQAAEKSKHGAKVAGQHIKAGANKTGTFLKGLFKKK